MTNEDCSDIARDLRATPAWRLSAISRGLALFLGGFTVLNLLFELRSPGFDGNLWWIDLRWLPVAAGRIALLCTAGMLLAYALSPRFGRWRRVATLAVVVLLGGVTLTNAATYYLLLARGILHAGPCVSFSLFITAALLVIGYPILRNVAPVDDLRSRRWLFVTFSAALVAFPLAQIYCFGNTDHRRPADAIVVFGACVHANGSMAPVLTDRVLTACRLYQEGYAPLLIFSGGPGEGAVYEPEAMRRFALRQGIPDRAILLDRNGLDTRATVRNTATIFRQRHIRRVIAVSQFFHLPRIKMTYLCSGYDVYTVPAAAVYPVNSVPWLVTREVAALWEYYVFKAS
ncbi:MAG: YdcF family protein [Acidobacteria bacterium]|nr:YdcF family protein [Acidobacteriota bacterium]